MPTGEDHHPRGGGGPSAGGRRGLDPATRHRQDRPQEPSADAHQRQGNVNIKYEKIQVLLIIVTMCVIKNTFYVMKML